MATVEAYETVAGKRYRVRYRKPDRSQTTKRGFRTKREAELYLAGVELGKASGTYIDPSSARVTVGELSSQQGEVPCSGAPSPRSAVVGTGGRRQGSSDPRQPCARGWASQKGGPGTPLSHARTASPPGGGVRSAFDVDAPAWVHRAALRRGDSPLGTRHRSRHATNLDLPQCRARQRLGHRRDPQDPQAAERAVSWATRRRR
ncbi:MAG: Arm DNA-binding domain-containing protein [Actinomycetota bacterium]